MFSVFASWYWLTKDLFLSIPKSHFIYSFLFLADITFLAIAPTVVKIWSLPFRPLPHCVRSSSCFFSLNKVVSFSQLSPFFPSPPLSLYLSIPQLSFNPSTPLALISLHLHVVHGSRTFLAPSPLYLLPLEWSCLYHQVSHYLSFFLVIFLPPSVHLRFCLTGNSLLGFKQRWVVRYSISWGMLLISITYEDLLPHQEVFPVLHTCFKIKITDNMKVKLNFQ